VVLAACALAAYAVAGGPAAVLVALIFSALALVVVNRLPAPAPGPPAQPEIPTGRRLPSRSSINYWRWRTDLTAAIGSIGSYQTNLGPDLQHLLAARLSERHGVSLYQQPDLARTLLCPGPGISTYGPGSTRNGPRPTAWTVPASRARRSPALSKGWNDYERYRAHA